MKFIITIDVEEDNPWNRPREVKTLNGRYIPRFQQLCDRYHFKPTYLCSYEMMQSREFTTFAQGVLEDGKGEFGAHLHPWRCPPFEELTGEDYKHLPYPHEFPDQIIRAKLKELTRIQKEALGIRPESYRAGRWGFVSRHIPILEELGYRVDSSVTPKVSWKDTLGVPGGEGGPDFSHAGVRPDFLYRDKNKNQVSNIIEVPVTILFPFGPFNKWNIQKAFFTNNRNIALRKILGRMGLIPQWLRPYSYMETRDLVRLHQRARELELSCLNLMFHSNELMPGGSPYNPDESAVETLYLKLEGFFEYLCKENVVGATMSEFAEGFKKDG